MQTDNDSAIKTQNKRFKEEDLLSPSSKDQVKDLENNTLDEESIQLFSNGLVKIPVAKKGKFFHPSYGKVEFTDKDFESIKQNFSNDCLGFSPYATYGHLIDPSLTIDAELKKGNTKDIQEENGVLYVLSEPTPDALDLIQKGEYEYSSGEFIRNYIDKETGENRGTVLMRYALTNSPFIPFKDKKIEILSQNSECPQTITEFVLKLSLESGIPPIPQSLDISLDNMQDNKIEEKKEISAEPNLEVTPEVEEQVEQVSVVAAEVKPESAAKVSADPVESKVQSPSVDVKGIVQEAFTQAKELYQAQIEAVRIEAKNAIEAIKAENATLKDSLQTQAVTVQAFSNSMSEAEKRARYQVLANQGVPASFIQRFSQLESALQTGSQVIKLSNSAGEQEDKAVSEEIAALLIDALHSEPVQVEQFGQSISTVAANSLVADMQKLVEANRKAATKVSIA